MDDRVDYVTAKQSGEILNDVSTRLSFWNHEDVISKVLPPTYIQHAIITEIQIVNTEMIDASICLDNIVFS